ncbi:MAG: hypothetical protein JWN10_97 [Solirubrobacterales bacterium]|nr:hypothetical protein [Solirubrobacterales bacterium]
MSARELPAKPTLERNWSILQRAGRLLAFALRDLR